MKAILITVLGSFLALSVSAQTTTGMQTTGDKAIAPRPIKVADSTTPMQMANTPNQSNISIAVPAEEVIKAPGISDDGGKKEENINPSGNSVLPNAGDKVIRAKDDAAGQEPK